MSRTWLLSGIPRSGNGLCCLLADKVPDTVALSQPFNSSYEFDGRAFGGIPRDAGGACARIAEFAEKVREQILASGRAPSHQVGGSLYDNIMTSERSTDTGLRERRGEWGEILVDKPLSARFTLLLSHPAMYSALLPHLKRSFSCAAVVRNPLSVLASWQTVNLPFRRGRIAGAEPYDAELRRELADEPDVLRRQLIILDWFFARYCTHLDPRNVIRYEDVIETGGLVLYRLLGHSQAKPVVLTSRNDNPVYERHGIDTLLDALLEADGHWMRFYDSSDLERVAAGIRRGPVGAGTASVGASLAPSPPGDIAQAAGARSVEDLGAESGRPRARRSTAVDSSATPEAPRTIWFHRGYERATGGSIKHSHYFEHVLRMPGFTPLITFVGEPSNEVHARTLQGLWPDRDRATVARWEPRNRGIFFLAGVDWRYLATSGLQSLPNPRINLIQGVRHAREGTELHGYLSERAIRICVSEEVANAISATGRTNGPVLTIPNGIDVAPFVPVREGGSPAGYESRLLSIVIAGTKNRDLARELSRKLDLEQIDHVLLTEMLDRATFLGLLAECRIAVCLPYAEEGFYLSALEAMASGSLVVTLDCIGNRSFCHHERNCLIAEPDPESLLCATKNALAMPAAEFRRMHRQARATAAAHSLEAERRRFHAILGDIDRLWRDG